MRTVDLKLGGKWEGLDYHRFLWQRCSNHVVVRPLLIQAGILEHRGHIWVEYHTTQTTFESILAGKMIRAWMANVVDDRKSWRFEFDDGNEAMVFKLTFGGS